MADARDHDIVLFGATGFTGGLTADYLAEYLPPKSRWAIAGRNREKLEQVRARLAARFPDCAELPLLVADTAEPESLKKVARSARVVITTVGPYILHGEPLVAACADAGTDYVDLTGEPEFVDLMWLRYHEQAKASGARLVHSCGFDSIPYDLGVWFTVNQLPEGVPLEVEGFVRSGGTFSAGTYHSAVHAFSRARGYVGIRKERIAREPRPEGRRIGSLPGGVRKDDRVGTWVVPFPTIDPQVVKRSAAALDRYGPEFRYGHYVQIKKFTNVAGLIGGATALFGLAQTKLTRDWLLKQKRAGDGPDEERRAKSWFKLSFFGRGGGQQVATQVSGGDPGYTETSKMIAESAMALAFDDLPGTAGQVTPVTAMGDALLKRLMGAGIEFKVVEGA